MLDINQDRLNELMLEKLPVHVPTLCADAGLPANLTLAGLNHPDCCGVLAMCHDDLVNLKIAIACRLLSPGLTVICRAESHDTSVNMESFDTDAIINPFDTFAVRLALAVHSPDLHLITNGSPQSPACRCRSGSTRRTAPGWLVASAVSARRCSAISSSSVYRTVIVEKEPVKTGAPTGAIIGRGTEAVTLRAAHIEQAVGIVAGTDDDANNLSVIMTARELNPNLFLVARQNDSENDALFRAARLDLVMQRARTISRRILALVMAPQLADFLRLARHQKPAWAQDLIGDLRLILGGLSPDHWSVSVTEEQAPAVHAWLQEGNTLPLSLLMRDPRDRERQLHAMALLLRRGKEETLRPGEETEIQPGDKILFCGRLGVAAYQYRTLNEERIVRYLVSGETRPQGALWRWFARRGG